jgi:photosystem II stability/assembly factor-like uncharacterized protein
VILPLLGTVAALVVPSLPGNAVAFADAQRGWAGGSGGLLGTTDGGKTWHFEVRAPIGAIAAVDGKHAWAVTGDGFILRTADGRTWQRLGAPHLVRLKFLDRRHGFGLYRDGVVVRSGNGGHTWTRVRTPGLMQAECFTNARDGRVARGGSVWTTHDGGLRWTRSRLRPERQGFPIPELGCRGRDVWAVFHEGAAAGTEGYHVFRSLDGGSTWRAVLASPFQRRLPPISNYAGPFSVLGGGAAVFLGDCSPCEGFGTATVVRTLDGGASFRRTTPFHGYGPQAVAFVDARRGWLLTGAHIGSSTPARLGLVWRTYDGGRRWKVVLRSPRLAP